ncbi:MAG TPA: hypothetical protein VIM48_06905 [Chthoniobacterales bacterium]
MRILLSLAAAVFLGSSAFGATVNDFVGTWAGTRVKTYKGTESKYLEVDSYRSTGDGGLILRSTIHMPQGVAHIFYQLFKDGSVEQTGVLKGELYGSYSGWWRLNNDMLIIYLHTDGGGTYRYGTIKVRIVGNALALTNAWSDGVQVAAHLVKR